MYVDFGQHVRYSSNAINISFDLVISCSVTADTVAVHDMLMPYSTACVRSKLDTISFEHTSHPLSSFDRISHQIIIIDRTSHPILSVNNTSLPFVSDAAKLFLH